LERHESTVRYQPKVDLRIGEITGAEAVIRWMHPNSGIISPGHQQSQCEIGGGNEIYQYRSGTAPKCLDSR